MHIPSEKNFIMRHADKGSWTVDYNQLEERLGKENSLILKEVLETNFPGMAETPLKIDGLQRSLAFADKLYVSLPGNAIVLFMDSAKPRARLTSKIIAGKLYFLEKADKSGKKRVDMAEVQTDELVNILEDASEATWEPYGEMIKDEGISEEEALARWMNGMQKDIEDAKNHPHEAAERYRGIIRKIRELFTSKAVPVYFIGIGHSGALGQIRMEEGLKEAKANDAPGFCEVFEFDNEGKLVRTEKTEI